MSARGKALVAKLRKQAGVRDAEALAAWIGRFKRARNSGMGLAAARKAAGGGASGGPEKSGGALADRVRKGSSPKKAEKKSVLAKKRPADDDDPFAEDYGDNETKSKEDSQRERMEKQLVEQMRKADRAKVYRVIQEQGGLKTNAALREEYSGIPNAFKRKDGLGGDEMADHLATYYPELAVRSERDLIDFLAA